jgi:putative transposase
MQKHQGFLCLPYGTSVLYAETVFLAHRIRLVPTAKQTEYFCKACGVARFAYNWALAEWERSFVQGEQRSELYFRRKLNAIKDEQFPWMREVTKCAPQHAIKNLGNAYTNFFADIRRARAGELSWRRVRKPRFKRKGIRDSFRADNGPERNCVRVRTDGKRIKLPKVGWIKMREAVRFDGRILSVTISREADRWYASVVVEIDWRPPLRTDDQIAGCDLGVRVLATIADSCGIRKEYAPRPLRRLAGKLRRLNRSLSRKVKGSRNREKAKAKLTRLHVRIADIRRDALHKLTTRLVRDYRVIGIEDLYVLGMIANRYLSRAISDLGLGEFRRQLEYKAGLRGSTVIVVDKWFPSSKLCSKCHILNTSLSFGEAQWQCHECHVWHDRDENAADNLRLAAGSAVTACGANGAGSASAK